MILMASVYAIQRDMGWTSWKPQQPLCPACKTHHWPSMSCSWKTDGHPNLVPSNLVTLCVICHKFHVPGTYCQPPQPPPTTDEEKANWAADFSEKLYEATRPKKGKP